MRATGISVNLTVSDRIPRSALPIVESGIHLAAFVARCSVQPVGLFLNADTFKPGHEDEVQCGGSRG